jgi:hypothetical protein
MNVLLGFSAFIITYGIILSIPLFLGNTQGWEWIFIFGGFLAALIVGVAVIKHFIQLNENEKLHHAKEAEQKAAEEARIRKHNEEQYGYRKEIIVLGENSVSLFESMPEHLKSAEEYLNQAEFEFSEGAFAPFWDAIEEATNTLGYFDEGINNIIYNSSRYGDLVLDYEGVAPKFPLACESVKKLSVGTSTAKRMKHIVRIAQRNFQFATIYEQRKTNELLVEGFTNLAQALDKMTWKITDSIDNLASSVDSMALTSDDSMKAVCSRLDDLAEKNNKYNSEVIKLESDRIAREKKALEMLDNIQCHRKPSLL